MESMTQIYSTVYFSATRRPTFWTPIMLSAMRISIWAYSYSDQKMNVYFYSGRVMNLRMRGAVPPIPHKSSLVELAPRLCCRHLALTLFCWQWCWAIRTAQWLTYVMDHRRSGSQFLSRSRYLPVPEHSEHIRPPLAGVLFWWLQKSD